MVNSTYILAPQVVKVRFDVAPAFNALESIREFNEVDRLSGFSEWVTENAASLPPRRRELNLIVLELLGALIFDVMPAMLVANDYLSYVEAVASRDATELRDGIVNAMVEMSRHHHELWDANDGELTAERLLSDQAVYAKFAATCCEKFPEVHGGVVADEHALLNDPPQMQALIVEHLHWMWDNVLADEWERVHPMLQESVAAFETMDFSNMTAYEAIRAVTTRDLRGKFDEKMEDVDTIVFIPSAHIGPYVVTTKLGTTVYMVFGARLPRGWQTPSSALSRSELLIRLNALADDTRLRILELLTKHEELCAQDIIEQLNLSQSSISRHLSQLSANGFITERRREVAKCYSLNTDRLVDTLRTLTNYLSRP